MEKKNIFCTIVGRWYKELKIKEFWVFDNLELLFLNVIFQNNYFKKHISQKTKLNTRVWSVCASLTVPLSFCVLD